MYHLTVIKLPSPPTLKHTITPDSDIRHVACLTVLSGRLFVLYWPNQHQIDVYDLETELRRQPSISINDMSGNTTGLASCVTNTAVYVSDTDGRKIYKIQLKRGDYQVSDWPVAGEPRRLSVNTDCNLLVACCDRINEYTTGGRLEKSILLNWLGGSQLLHAIQLTKSQFIVSLADDVVEVDNEGQLVVSYKKTGLLDSTSKAFFNRPVLAIDETNKCIFVADCGNDRIVLVNRSLKRGLEFDLASTVIKSLSTVYYDASCGRLFVGEGELVDIAGNNRVLVFDNVSNVADRF